MRLRLRLPFEVTGARGHPARVRDRVAELAQDGYLPVERLDPVLDQLPGPGPLAWADGPAEGQPRQRLDLLTPESEVFERERGLDVAAVRPWPLTNCAVTSK